MLKGLLVSCGLVGAGLIAGSAQAATLQQGRSTYVHHYHQAAHNYHMLYGHHSHARHRHGATATGGTPGGLPNRN